MIKYNTLDPKLAKIAGIVEKRMKKPMDLELILDDSYDEYSGRIHGKTLYSGSHNMLLELAGRVLRHPELLKKDTIVHSHKEVCGMYFATHFNNYLDAAPLDEIREYMEDLALWGMNTFSLWFDMHHFRNMEEGKEKSDRCLALLKIAQDMGININFTGLANEAFADSPVELRADWTSGHDGYIQDLREHYHVEICPNKPGGLEKILEYRRKMLDVFKEIRPTYISFGPYDQGGCTCSKCAPWGGNGYVKTVKALIPLYREYFGDVKFCLDTWQFGSFTGTDVEFEMLSAAIKNGEFGEVYRTRSEPQYARYPFEKGWPTKITGFPEISMYQANPWGGYGTNPLPGLLGDLWKKNGPLQDGGEPYSEGFYEDINKVIMLRCYRENQDPVDTIREYLAWEFDLEGEDLEAMVQAMVDMEETWERIHPYKTVTDHTYTIVRPEKVAGIEATVCRVHEKLPETIRESKRWQMIYLRAVIDGELARNNFTRNEKVLGYFHKIVELCYLQNAGLATRPDIWD